MKIRNATEADIPTVVTIWSEAAQWLRTNGYDQWQYPIKMHNIEAEVRGRNCWLIEDHGNAVAIVTLEELPDTDLWQESDDPHNALYLHRLAIRREHGGRQIGSAIIDWASQRAAAAGKAWLRLDAWTNNPDLHRYYENLNFRHVRTVNGPDTESGALFERPAGYTLGRGPNLQLALITDG